MQLTTPFTEIPNDMTLLTNVVNFHPFASFIFGLMAATAAAQGGSPRRQEFQFDADTDVRDLSEHELYVLTQNLKDEEASKRPLISELEGLGEFHKEYEHGDLRVARKINWLLSQGWKGIRRSRGDGDCFYRSLAYAYVERLMQAEDQGLAVATARSILEGTLPLLDAAGFDRMAYEDFYEVFVDLIDSISQPSKTGKVLTPEALLEFFQTPEYSNSVVAYLRLLTSALMRNDEESFAPFLLHPDTFEPMEVVQFCQTFVESPGKEADHPQITALSRALSFGLEVAYLDGNTSGVSATAGPDSVDFVKFEPEGSKYNGSKPVVLLYRPGHYDILEQ